MFGLFYTLSEQPGDHVVPKVSIIAQHIHINMKYQLKSAINIKNKIPQSSVPFYSSFIKYKYVLNCITISEKD